MKQAAIHDKAIIVDMLARSFDDNKSVNYVVKQDLQRAKRLKALMEYSFNVCNEFGEIWLSDNHLACALILFPDAKKITFRSLLWDLKLALSVIGLDRIGKVIKRESMIKANHPSSPIAYLWFIGVVPNAQGKGMGSSLMTELIEEYTNRNRPLYLETSTERNLPFYQRLGFQVFKSLQLSYKLYQLRRALTH